MDILGGPLSPVLQASELLERSVEGLYWDIAFMGVGAVDVKRGITTLDQSNAQYRQAHDRACGQGNCIV